METTCYIKAHTIVGYEGSCNINIVGRHSELIACNSYGA